MNTAFLNAKVTQKLTKILLYYRFIYLRFIEYLVNLTLDICNCVAPFFPDRIDRSRYRNCSMFDHISCIKKRLLDFNQTSRMTCNCGKDCAKTEPVAQQIQYGHKWSDSSSQIDNNVGEVRRRNQYHKTLMKSRLPKLELHQS